MTRLVNRLTQLSGALFYFIFYLPEERNGPNGAVFASTRPSQTDESIDSVELSKARPSLCEK